MNKQPCTLKIKDSTEIPFEKMKDITVLYARLSQEDDKEGESNSIANQKQLLAYEAERRGLKNCIFFVDDGYSGTNFFRPAIQQIMALINASQVKTFIVKDLSRLGRDLMGSLNLIQNVFPENDIHFLAINDNVDSDHGIDINMLFRLLLNHIYPEETSEKIKNAFKTKSQRGESLSFVVPYGYRKDPEDDVKWIIDEEAAEIVKQIFAYSIEGHGLTRIAKMLEEQKILNPTAHKMKFRRKKDQRIIDFPYHWQFGTVRGILERMEYLGHTANFKTYKKNFRSKKVSFTPKEKWQIIKDTHQPIIDEHTFEIVQRNLQHKRRHTKNNEKGLFSGLIFCADCGHKLYFSVAPTKHYACSGFRNHKINCNHTHYINQAKLETIVLTDIKRLTNHIKKHEKEFAEYVKMRDDIQSEATVLKLDKQLKKAEKRYKNLDVIIQHLYEDKISGNLSDERFSKLITTYEMEQTELEQLIEESKNALEEQEAQSEGLDKFMKIAKNYLSPDKLTNKMVIEFIERIDVCKPEKIDGKRTQAISIHYNFIGLVGDLEQTNATQEEQQLLTSLKPISLV
ncbi:DUF4368 domain-containing protein [Enterococcus sp. BWM-S5]|uniref:DUF4368 domain-containing protein n=1 Tax=Enterococcus larvae TaxID=2794352 RepID=A0ABS4CI73_9ENTE|nr:recombinase family protein [Enterococcus larvae]MBP1045637.1 DUF4368 domain-containing protein [Enterococcus larvae]